VGTCHAMGGHGWAHVMLWVGMGGHRPMLMVMVWVWVQIRRKMLGYGAYTTTNSYQDGNSPTGVGQSLVLVWA
jgi:hypothetical protein